MITHFLDLFIGDEWTGRLNFFDESDESSIERSRNDIPTGWDYTRLTLNKLRLFHPYEVIFKNQKPHRIVGPALSLTMVGGNPPVLQRSESKCEEFTGWPKGGFIYRLSENGLFIGVWEDGVESREYKTKIWEYVEDSA